MRRIARVFEAAMLREALASAFLQHAVPKGLNFAFVELLGGTLWKGGDR